VTTQQLVIVRPGRFATFALLAEVFADDPNLRLIWDPRVRDRRGQAVSRVPSDRRRQDRRSSVIGWEDHEYVVFSRAINIAGGDFPRPSIPRTDAYVNATEQFHGHAQQDIEAAVRSDVNVLITGGDPLSRKALARRIHRRSNRGNGSFIVVDRGAIPLFGASEPLGTMQAAETDVHDAPGIDVALGGTLLIEEVADLSWREQAALLRFLEGCPVQPSGRRAVNARDARVISATEYCLVDRITAAQFRPDLFYLLNLIHLVLPSGTVRGSAWRFEQGVSGALSAEICDTYSG